MLAKYSWEMGSILLALMGCLHLYLTFFSKKLYPRNKQVAQDMSTTPLLLSDQLMFWKAWIGFNATHSSGVMFIGIVNFYLATTYFEWLTADPFLRLLTLVTVSFYVWIAYRYWFRTVFRLLTLAWFLFVGSYILSILKL